MKQGRTLIEMRELFGDLIVWQAQRTDPADLRLAPGLMDRVHDGADALLTMRGDPAEQRRYVAELPYESRLVLCMWLLDTEMAAKLVRAIHAKGM